MVGISLIPVGTSKLLHIDYSGEPIQPISFLAAGVTLLVMVALTLWGGAKLRLYSVLIGMALGYAMSALAGLLPMDRLERVAGAPWFGVPMLDHMFDVTFRWSLLPAFVIVSICGALKSFGNLIMCEKVNDDEWKQPDIKRIGDGLVADGLCVTLSGVLGGVASDTSSSNVSLSSASGATSRYIGYAAGGLFIVLGFSPKLGALLSIMPAPVQGAILVFVTCFMVMSGLQIILTSKPDTKTTFVIGAALVFGLSLDIVPDLYAQVPHWMRPLFDSSLTLATVVAVTLNQLLRWGAASAASKAAVPADQRLVDH